MIFTILTSVFVIISSIGYFVARWTIKQYDKAPHYATDDRTQKLIYSTHALNESNSDLKSTLNDNNDHDEKCKLETKLPVYEGPNPFTIKKLSIYERCKIYFFCMTGIALIRIFSFFLCAFGLYLLSLPITICFKPNGFMHTQLIKFIRYWIGIALFLFGFYFIDFSDSTNNNNNNNNKHDIRVIVANHQTMFDGLVILWKTNGVIAAKKEISKAPIFGRIMNALQTLWIDRSGKKGRNYAKQQIIDHVNNLNTPPLIIFPQGTCSNVHTVTSFKTGAYLTKQKILEISLNWSKNKSCDLSFVSNVNTMARIIHVGCCQFINYCHVDIHNIHSPNLEEENDCNLFAENSRKMVVKSLNEYNLNPSKPIIATQHSYSDWILLQKAYKFNKNFNTSHVLMDDIISNLRLRTKTVTYLADIFSKFDLNKSGWIEYDEFCTAFNRDPNENSKQMMDLFNVFNTENNNLNKIGFNEFLVGVATCFIDDKIQDAVKIMFNANKNDDNDEYVLKENILNTYQRHVDKSKFDENKNNDGDNNKNDGYDEWLKKMKIFLNQIFGKENKLKFDEFYQEIEKNKYQNMIQHYLQSIILMRLKIKLTKNDFAIKDEKIYVNPLAELVRSTSIKSVHQS